jgi:hypothetical protein
VEGGKGDAQICGLHAQLDVLPGKDLGALCAAYALHRAFLRAAADGHGADVALVFEEFGRDGARRRTHAVVELVGVSICALYEIGKTTHHDHVLCFKRLRRARLIRILPKADDIKSLIRRADAISKIIPYERREVVAVELRGAERLLPARDRRVVDVELVLVVEAGGDTKDVVLRRAPPEGFGKGRRVALHKRLVGEEVARQLAGRVQGFVGAEAGASERVFVGLRVDLFEAIVAKDCIA